jgi:hypothetical protein
MASKFYMIVALGLFAGLVTLFLASLPVEVTAIPPENWLLITGTIAGLVAAGALATFFGG